MRAMIATARLRIAYRELPNRLPEMTLRGVSEGATCSLCKRPIAPHALEVEFMDSATTKMYVLHPECHTAWSIAVRRMSPETRDETGPAESRLDPSS
jgi:hypothetical protein